MSRSRFAVFVAFVLVFPTQSGASPETAGVLLDKAASFVESGQVNEAAALGRQALQEIDQSQDPDQLKILGVIGRFFLQIDHLRDAETAFNRTLEILAPSLEIRDEFALGTLYQIAEIYGENGHILHAEGLYQRLLALLEIDPPYNAERIAQTHDALARLYYDIRRFDDAEREFRAALDLLELRAGKERKLLERAISNLQTFLEVLGKQEELLDLHRRAIEIAIRLGSDALPLRLEHRERLANLLEKQRRPNEATEQLETALLEAQREWGLMDERSIDLMAPLAIHLSSLGKEKEAIELFEALLRRPEVLVDSRRLFPLISLGSLRAKQKQYAAANTAYSEALSLLQKHPVSYEYYENIVDSLVNIKLDQFDYDGAVELAIARLASVPNPEEPSRARARALQTLGSVMAHHGSWIAADKFFNWYVEDIEALATEQDSADELKEAAILYGRFGRWGQAVDLISRHVSLISSTKGPDSVEMAYALRSWANMLRGTGRGDQARDLFQRAREILISRSGKGHPPTPAMAAGFLEIAKDESRDGRFADAQKTLEKVLEMYRDLYGDHSEEVARTFLHLGRVSKAQGRMARAKEWMEAAIRLYRSLKLEGTALAVALTTYGQLAGDLGESTEALALLEESNDIRRRILGQKHPNTLAVEQEIALALHAAGQPEAALTRSRRVLGDMAERLGELEGEGTSDALSEAAIYRNIFNRHLDFLMVGKRLPANRRGEAFETLQRARSTAASRALQRASVRLALDLPTVQQKMQEQRSLTARLEALEKALRAALTYPDPNEAAGAQTRQRLGNDRQEVLERLRVLESEMRESVPELMDLLKPDPVGLKETQASLLPGEVLVAFLSERDVTWMAVVRRENSAVHRLPVSQERLRDAVNKLRAAVVPNDALSSSEKKFADELRGVKVEGAWRASFPVEVSHELFKALFTKNKDKIKPGERLLLVPDGPLSALSFSLLVAEPPPQITSDADYSAVAWLGHRNPIVVLPSISALNPKRRAMRSRASQPFFGVADPILNGKRAAARPGALIDSNWPDHLLPLKETASEVEAMAIRLGADPISSILVGESATEGAVKATNLSQYRILAFATHGLIAGEFGLTQPALVLTPPTTDGDPEDGLLTVEEAAGLSLDADLALLSACNTAAGSGVQDNEWLSGLASAFLLAGARSVLVSHWPIPSQSTVALTTELLGGIALENYEPAEAHRRAMVATSAIPGYAHPSFWAGFSMVGDFRRGSLR